MQKKNLKMHKREKIVVGREFRIKKEQQTLIIQVYQLANYHKIVT